MSANLATVAYIGAAILFILSLGGLSNPETARRGNLYGMVGMAIAVLATIFGPRVTAAGIPYIVGALLIGGSIGLYADKESADDADAGAGRSDAFARRSGGLPRRLCQLHRHFCRLRGRRESDPRSRDLHRHLHRRRDVLRLDHRVLQAVRKDRRQATAAAGAALAESRRPARRDLVRRCVRAGA